MKENTYKQKEQNKIQSSNILEEASLLSERCINCGLCEGVCPTFRVEKDETFSPRGLILSIKEKLTSEELKKNTLSLNQNKSCPLNIDIYEALIMAKESRILKGKTNKKEEEIINNIINSGNPIGIKEW